MHELWKTIQKIKTFLEKERANMYNDIMFKIMNWNVGHQDEDILNSFLDRSYKAYQNELDKIQIDDDENIYFAWSKNNLHIYLVRVSDGLNMKLVIAMAAKEENLDKNKITYIDKSTETDYGNFTHANENEKLVCCLLNTI